MPSNNKTEQSVQELQNQSFDKDFKVNAVEPVVFNPETGNLDKMVQPATNTKLTEVLAEIQTKTTPTDIQLGELIPVLRNLILAIANPSYVDKSANVIRNQVQSGTVTTVTTVTNLTNLGSFSADHLHRMDNMTAWAINVRSLIK